MTDNPAESVRQAAVRIAALSQSGLVYASDEFDRVRYTQLAAAAVDLLAAISGEPRAALALQLGRDVGYATPKVDVRGAVFDDAHRVLLLRERSDGRWSLPGGWADPGETPAQAVAREIAEETGYTAVARKLVGCWDRDAQGNTPPLPVHVYKLFFLCEATAGEPVEASVLETLDVGWFAVHDLPPLSLGRVTPRQIQRALAHRLDPGLPTEFD